MNGKGELGTKLIEKICYAIDLFIYDVFFFFISFKRLNIKKKANIKFRIN